MMEASGIYLFPNWETMIDAQWLYDEWPYDTEPVLLCIDTSGLQLSFGAGYEVVSITSISPDRITLIGQADICWDAAQIVFEQAGGLVRCNDSDSLDAPTV